MDPFAYSKAEMQRVLRNYCIELTKYNFLGPHTDCPGPDVGTTTWHMDVLHDTYRTLYGLKEIDGSACVTGKSADAGGINGRTESTGLGVYYMARDVLTKDIFHNLREKHNIDHAGIKGKTVVIQGFGNVGYWAAKFLHDDGAKIIGVVERDGSIFNENGINPDALRNHILETRGVKGFADSTYSETNEFFYKQCDILIPAALEKSLNQDNADLFKTKLIVEGGNGTTTVRADNILNDKNVLIIPDILANAAGVTCSYFEF